MPVTVIPRRRRRNLAAIPAIGAAGLAAVLLIAATHGPAGAASLVSSSTATVQGAISAQTTPAVAADPDPGSVELGAQFHTSVAGTVSGVRFYKSSTNTGTHVGDLWDASGHKLATATFTGETASGWQSVSFSAPVAISPNTTYVVSYHTKTGHYSDQASTFTDGATLSNGVVTETAGVYVYGSGGFPTQTWDDSSYFVDVSFIAGSGSAAPSASTSPTATPIGKPSPTVKPRPVHSHGGGSDSPSTSAPSTPAPTTPAPSVTPSTPAPTTPAPTTPAPTTPAPTTPAPTTAAPSTSAPAPSPTKSASPSGQQNCFAAPSACGYPDSTNTGVPAGTVLTNSGSITLSTPGQVVSGLRVNGTVTITASNVTFKNSIVDGSISVAYGNQTGDLIDHVEVSGDGSDPGISGAGFTANAVNVHGTGDGIDVQNNDVVTNSWIHGLVVPSGAHVDGLQSAGGNALTVNHNTIDSTCNGCNSAVIIGADLGAFTGQQVLSNNLFAGGGFTAYAGTGGYNATNMISFLNNRFVNDAGYGPCNFNVPEIFTGNTTDTGAALSCSG